MREFVSSDRNRCAQMYESGCGWEVVLTYGGNPHRKIAGLDRDVALHIARRWAQAGHLPEDPYVPTAERAA